MNEPMAKPKLFRVLTVDRSLESLLEGQLHYLTAEFEVVGVADDSGRLDRVAEREGIRTVAVPMRRAIRLGADLRALWLLFRLFRRERPYIVHASTPKAALLSMMAAWAARVPHRLYTVTGLRFETTHGLLRFVLKTMERISCLCATKVIPEGDGVRDILRRERITRKPLQKILNGNINGVDLVRFDRTDEVLRRAAEVRGADEGFTFVFVGRLVRDKGLEELAVAFDRLTREFPTARLLLVGCSERELDPLSPATERILAANDRIEAVGFQSDVRPYLAAADALVLPSYREGFPNVVLQAGAMGLPAVVTDISGSNEIVCEGRNGTLVPPRDAEALYRALRRFVAEPELVRAMAAAARPMVAERFRREAFWAALSDMYRSLK